MLGHFWRGWDRHRLVPAFTDPAGARTTSDLYRVVQKMGPKRPDGNLFGIEAPSPSRRNLPLADNASFHDNTLDLGVHLARLAERPRFTSHLLRPFAR